MELRKKVDIIENDKNYLTKENIAYAEKLCAYENKFEKYEEELS